MITLKKLKWSNCFSYGPDNELDLDDNTVTQIIGTNGMGKSSIPLIIEEVLYNKNSKGIKKADIPNRYVNKGYNISLSFEKDGSNYSIIVDRKTSIKVRLEKNGEDISSHTATNTYKTLQEILGIDTTVSKRSNNFFVQVLKDQGLTPIEMAGGKKGFRLNETISL